MELNENFWALFDSKTKFFAKDVCNFYWLKDWKIPDLMDDGEPFAGR